MSATGDRSSAFDRATADQAADWLTLLMSGDATDADRRAWQVWRDASPEHERTWRHVESVTGRIQGLQAGIGYRVLTPYAQAGNAASGSPGSGRRRAIRTLAWGVPIAGATVLAGAAAWSPLRTVLADHRTGTAERREITLDDGTHLTLNARSAVDIRFDATRRLVVLLAGEVLITTGRAAGAAETRPFLVRTHDGDIEALGTRFVVRQHTGFTTAAVLRSAVRIIPADAAGLHRVFAAGRQVRFTRGDITDDRTVTDATAAWSRGQIIADNLRLADFLDELRPYRRGVLAHDPGIADLRLSGVFPLDDTDRILATLPGVLPVRLQTRTRYWVVVQAR